MLTRWPAGILLAAGMLTSAALVSARGKNSIAHTSAAAAVDRVIVNPASVKTTIPTNFLGINFVAFWDNTQGSVGSAKALAQVGIRTLRFPGGAPADSYDWQDPYYKGQSRTSPLQLWHFAQSIGAKHVIFQTNYQGNLPKPPSKPYAVNSKENAAAWVKYNTKMRINADMEVGNEEDLKLMHKKDDPAFAAYVSTFSAQARAMHRASRHVRVLGPAAVNEYYWLTLNGLDMFLRGAGNRTGTGQVDGISLHFYRGNSWTDARGVAQYWLSRDGPWAAIQTTIGANDRRKLPVYVTEWNLGSSDPPNNSFTPTLGHALGIADMIGAFALSGVAGEDYFDIRWAHGWGVLYAQGEGRPVDSPTPTYYSMVLWGHMGKSMLALQQSSDASNEMSTYATKRNDGSLQVLAINKRSGPTTVRVALLGVSPNGHRLRVYSLTSATGRVDDQNARYNGVTMPSPQQRLPGPKDMGAVRGRSYSYSVPGYSAVVLDLGAK